MPPGNVSRMSNLRRLMSLSSLLNGTDFILGAQVLPKSNAYIMSLVQNIAVKTAIFNHISM